MNHWRARLRPVGRRRRRRRRPDRSEEHAECIYTEPPRNLSLKNSTLIDWRDQTAANYVDDNTDSCCGAVDVEKQRPRRRTPGQRRGLSQQRHHPRHLPKTGLYGRSAYDVSASGGSGFSQSGNIHDDTAATANP